MTSPPPRARDYRLITCIMPAGQGSEVLERLRREMQVTSASVHHARGIGTHSLHHRSMYYAEQQVLMALVEAERADDVFEFIYRIAGLDQPHAGMVFLEKAFRAAPLLVPEDDGPESTAQPPDR